MKLLMITLSAVFILLISCDKQTNQGSERIIHDTVFVEKNIPIESDPYPSPFKCGDSTSQSEMNICAAKEYLYFDSIMQMKYDSLLMTLDPSSEPDADQKKYLQNLKDQLIKSQMTWKEYMLSNAIYVSVEYQGGTIRPLMVSSQKTSDTKARIIALDNLRPMN